VRGAARSTRAAGRWARSAHSNRRFDSSGPRLIRRPSRLPARAARIAEGDSFRIHPIGSSRVSSKATGAESGRRLMHEAPSGQPGREAGCPLRSWPVVAPPGSPRRRQAFGPDGIAACLAAGKSGRPSRDRQILARLAVEAACSGSPRSRRRPGDPRSGALGAERLFEPQVRLERPSPYPKILVPPRESSEALRLVHARCAPHVRRRS